MTLSICRFHLIPALLAVLLIPVLLMVPAQAASSAFAGSERCGSCHQQQFHAWQGSHHQRAMATPDKNTVLGKFDDASFSAHGVTSQFFRKDDAWRVRTDASDGRLQDFPVRYTFGWYPLQQYLLEMPGGRLQGLTIAWDSRPASEGGQRWYHLYPEEKNMDHAHPLHWTGREQNWNYQCADCHSMGLKKHFDVAKDAYQTTWSEISVGCESCHGPGQDHVRWAENPAASNSASAIANKGLTVALPKLGGASWHFDAAKGIPVRSPSTGSPAEVEQCAACHSRRARISEEEIPGARFLDSFLPALLESDLYFDDGQMRGEVYEYGSFTQSKMYAAGVTCSNCHDSHSLTLRAKGNAVCTQCHEPARYDQPGHHQHKQGSVGAECKSCHMPERTYMGVDKRFDHSFRIPRPDLSLAVGSPNACNHCHTDQSPSWAQQRLQQWFPASARRGHHFGLDLHAARSGQPDGEARLQALAGDAAQPGIVRATALAELAGMQRPANQALLQKTLVDPDPLVRLAAVRYLPQAGPQMMVTLGWSLLEDPVLAVRSETARVLAPLMQQSLPAAHREYLGTRIAEYQRTQQVNAERPESQLNLGLVAAAQGHIEEAEAAYRNALRFDAGFIPAYVNLSDLYRATGRDGEGEQLLLTGLKVVPDSADLHHALGLLYVRSQRMAPALTHLQTASELAAENARYGYAYALVLESTGSLDRAIGVLKAVVAREPGNRNAAISLMQMLLKNDEPEAARGVLKDLRELYPNDRQLDSLKERIR